ncbi:hypothetical protein SAMN04487968_104162 [Nocardioides terrae]|uniref:Peptidase S53 domain-containing protein n=1 Tax=Nocardioides terrae TaxID=574651 RepID=A0A1I1H1M6_9ACTN|nr:S53 family peptidase [Nocardioides terrae]SFC18049.1 hypothetical protein SAMN04487968_104162 [Nocardioides terrae]
MRLRALLGSAALLASPLSVVTLSTGAQATDVQTVPAEPVTCQDLPRVAGQMTCMSEVGAAVAPTSVRSLARAQLSPQSGASKVGSYTPADIAALYRLPADAGAGTTVAVIEAGSSPELETNLATYRSRFGLAACSKANGCLSELNQSGGSVLPAPVAGWDFEINMDVQAVSAACPACRILVVGAASAYMNDLNAAVQTAVDRGARYVSMSYGGAEWSHQAVDDRVFATNPGVVFTASTGDDGFAGGTSFPASSTHVVAAGGTHVEKVSGVWHQTAWDHAGSGCSAYDPMPTVQRAASVAVTACGLKRATGDLSALADPHTGMLVYAQHAWYNGGGTSLSAPLIAAMYALAGNHTDPFSVYYKTAWLTDITSGATAGCDGSSRCTAGPGWDGPTGLGTPDGLAALSLQTRASTPAPALATPPVPPSQAPTSPAVTSHRFARSGAMRVSGPARRGRSVRASYGTFRADSLLGTVLRPAVTISWYVDGRVVRGAHGRRLVVRRAWAGKRLSFRITAVAPGFLPSTYLSRRTAKVR